MNAQFFRNLSESDKKLFGAERETWSDQEIIKLVEGRLNFGSDWEKIASHLGGTRKIS
jgi:hypothetical protein